MMLSLVLIISSVALVKARLLDVRSAQTSAVCQSEYSWTDNSNNNSPCILAAYVLAACAGNNWLVGALNGTNHYTPPINDTVNLCSCSWAAYNLLSACTLCQGFEQSIQTWPFYSQDCGNKLSNTYFPTQLVLPTGTLIPYYAATDPSTWKDQRFNLQDAKEKATEGHGDLSPVPPTPGKKSSNSVGAIVGGVIGGIAVLILAGIIAFFMVRRRKRNQGPHIVANSRDYTNKAGHNRTMSDLSQKSNGIGLGYQTLDRSSITSPLPQIPLSPGTMHTHTSSVNSLSYFGSAANSGLYASPTSPPGRMLSPSPPPLHHQGVNLEGLVIPFTLAPSPEVMQRQGSSSNLADRKRADGAIIPVYDSPNSPPVPQPAGPSNEVPSARRRINPPAYSPYPQGDQSSQAPGYNRPAHFKKGSGSSDNSFDSDGTARNGTMSGGGGGSISAIDDVIGQMGFGPAETVSGSGGTLATGLSGQVQRNQMFRPIVGNPDP